MGRLRYGMSSAIRRACPIQCPYLDVLEGQRRGIPSKLRPAPGEILCAIAQYGNVVIAGRGGFAVLAGLADVLNIRIQAPLMARIMRLVESPSVGDPGLAEQLVQKNDQLQKNFIKSVYGIEWDSAGAFDLVVDTGRITPDLAADMIVQATKALPAKGTSGARTTVDLGVDKVLLAAVDDVLTATHLR